MTGGGKTLVSPGAVLTISGHGGKYLSRVLEIQGTAEYTGSGLAFGAVQNGFGTIHTVVGGTFNALGDGDFGTYWEAAHTIQNEGTFTRSGVGTTTVTGGVTFNSNGTVEVRDGTLELAASVSQFSGSTLTGGTWAVFDNATLYIKSSSNITTNNAAVLLSGPNASFPKINSLATNNGTFTLDEGRDFTRTGDFTNYGHCDSRG